MYCRLDNTEETEQSLFFVVKKSVLTYSNVLKCMRTTGDGILSKLVFKVIIVINMYKTHYMLGQSPCR